MAAPRDENAPDDLITAKEALHKHHIEPATIRQWVSRGHIEPRGRRDRAYLYDRKELLKVVDIQPTGNIDVSPTHYPSADRPLSGLGRGPQRLTGSTHRSSAPVLKLH